MGSTFCDFDVFIRLVYDNNYMTTAIVVIPN